MEKNFLIKKKYNKKRKESTCHCREYGFNPWSRKILCALEQLNPCATSAEPCSRARAPQQEKPLQCEAHAPQWRVAPAHHNSRKPVQSNDPAQLKKTKNSPHVSCWEVKSHLPSLLAVLWVFNMTSQLMWSKLLCTAGIQPVLGGMKLLDIYDNWGLQRWVWIPQMSPCPLSSGNSRANGLCWFEITVA